MTKSHSVVLAALASLALSAPASAQVLYDNGPLGNLGNEMSHWVEADDFSLAEPGTIGGVRFWSVEAPRAYRGSIFWQILANDGGSPGATIADGLAAPTRSAVDGMVDVFQYDFSIAPLALSDGVYWLALHNGALTETENALMGWHLAVPNNTNEAHYDYLPFGDGDWSGVKAQQYAFVIYGANQSVVPEPATLLLTATGLLLLGVGARRRAAQAG